MCLETDSSCKSRVDYILDTEILFLLVYYETFEWACSGELQEETNKQKKYIEVF